MQSSLLPAPPVQPAVAHTAPTDISDPLSVACRLLADDDVRSVTLDAGADEATLVYRNRASQRASLAWLAERLRADNERLVATGALAPADPLAALPTEAVECWPDLETGRASYVRTAQEARGWRRVMHLTLAGVWFTLAVLGAILPGLPCTCFLLLTSYSLCRSSKRLHQRLLDSKWFGPTLRHWRVHRGVRPGVKTKALTMLVTMVGLSLALAPMPPIAWWSVAALGAIGAGCIAKLRVIRV